MADDAREKALAVLKEQIRAQRARLDPKLLALAEAAAKLSQKTVTDDDVVPYDRDAAAEAVRLFLKDHDDPEGLQAEIIARLRPRD